LGITTSTMERFNKSTGAVDPKRYRFTWRPRGTDDPNNWYAVTNLIVAANDTANPNYVNGVRAWMDVPNFFGPIVAHHLCGDWDSYGYERGKNMYAYKPASAGWRLLMWDIELGLGGAQSRAATDTIYNINDPSLRNLITNTPAFHRQYLAEFLEAMNTSFAPGAADALLDERYAAFLRNNVIMDSPQFIKTFMSQRRTYLLSQLPVADLGISGTNF